MICFEPSYECGRGGTGLSVAIDGVNTGTGNATYILPMKSTINLGNYTSPPSWQWFSMLGAG